MDNPKPGGEKMPHISLEEYLEQAGYKGTVDPPQSEPTPDQVETVKEAITALMRGEVSKIDFLTDGNINVTPIKNEEQEEEK